MLIKVEALDTLFFRDGKPFTMGQETWADGVFPPYPSVLYGALRSAYFAEHIAELKKANQKDDPTAGLKIKGIFLEIENDPCFPLPLDCVEEKNNESDQVAFQLKLKENTMVSSVPTPYILDSDRNTQVENVQGGYLNDLDFRRYLNAAMNEFYYYKLSDYVVVEEKIGIARDRTTYTAERAKLYRITLRRLNNVSIIIDFDGLELPESGFLKLGGEGKAAAYESIKSLPSLSLELKSNRFKLYLATPAIFKNGWLPGWINPRTLEGMYGGLRLKLLSAAVGKHVNIGGFDIEKGRPKPMRRAVPEGSVYFFELLEGEPARVMDLMHYKCISEYNPEQGFGISFVGAVK
ncbi:MAG: type III-B CRISPR module-associated protein Cmr3 [Firmicutes bacterium]|nr:type III-B CRISPR module-associated protein Cmr3 [Bacillota bacterium]